MGRGSSMGFFFGFFFVFFSARSMIAKPRTATPIPSSPPIVSCFFSPVHTKPFNRERKKTSTLDIASFGCNVPLIHGTVKSAYLGCHIHLHALIGLRLPDFAASLLFQPSRRDGLVTASLSS
ncbi:hypothetical protein LZ31DRAFT_45645 [Colletotrichum somersetense]|nr:hypothetical protein LZ31DRAFT_45645 [Colletotrichum somersetense]